MIEIEEDISIDKNRESIHVPDDLIPSRIMQRFTAAIKAIEDVLDHESDMLERHENPDFHDIHARKERSIHALNVISQENPQIGEAHTQGLLDDILLPLQTKLVRNERILKIHLDAVEELVEMISVAAQAREADGTYTPFVQI